MTDASTPAWTKEQIDALKSLPLQRKTLYFLEDDAMSPFRYYERIRGYWLFGIAMNLIATVLIAWAIVVTLTENAKTTVGMSRVDGVHVVESQDVRRDVLLKNSLKRSELQRAPAQK